MFLNIRLIVLTCFSISLVHSSSNKNKKRKNHPLSQDAIRCTKFARPESIDRLVQNLSMLHLTPTIKKSTNAKRRGQPFLRDSTNVVEIVQPKHEDVVVMYPAQTRTLTTQEQVLNRSLPLLDHEMHNGIIESPDGQEGNSSSVHVEHTPEKITTEGLRKKDMDENEHSWNNMKGQFSKKFPSLERAFDTILERFDSSLRIKEESTLMNTLNFRLNFMMRIEELASGVILPKVLWILISEYLTYAYLDTE